MKIVYKYSRPKNLGKPKKKCARLWRVQHASRDRAKGEFMIKRNGREYRRVSNVDVVKNKEINMCNLGCCLWTKHLAPANININ